MKKTKAKLILIIILLGILSNFMVDKLNFKSIKFFYLLHSLKGSTIVIEEDNTILIETIDLFLKIDGKYQIIKDYDISHIKNKESLDEQIFLFKYYHPQTGDFYLSVYYQKDKGNIQNDNFKCITKYNTNYCFSYIKNYEEPYFLKIGNKEYSIDQLSEYEL